MPRPLNSPRPPRYDAAQALSDLSSADPKLGFLSHAASVRSVVDSGTLTAAIKTVADARRMMFMSSARMTKKSRSFRQPSQRRCSVGGTRVDRRRSHTTVLLCAGKVLGIETGRWFMAWSVG